MPTPLLSPGDPTTVFDSSNMILLGQGTFGEVYKVTRGGRAFAVKVSELRADADARAAAAARALGF